MSNDPRNSQFAGWAKAVMEKLDIGPENDYTQLVLARAAYDLVEHAMREFCRMEDLEYEECYIVVPDLAELPEEQANEH